MSCQKHRDQLKSELPIVNKVITISRMSSSRKDYYEDRDFNQDMQKREEQDFRKNLYFPHIGLLPLDLPALEPQIQKYKKTS